MTSSERANLSHIGQIISDRQELIARDNAAEQLGIFLFAALRTLGKRDSDKSDAETELFLPLGGEQNWKLIVEANAEHVEAGDNTTPIYLRVWNMFSDDNNFGDDDPVSDISVRCGSETSWAAVLGGANVEKPEDDYYYENLPGSHQWCSGQIIGLTRDIVDAVQRYERQEGITAPPV